MSRRLLLNNKQENTKLDLSSLDVHLVMDGNSIFYWKSYQITKIIRDWMLPRVKSLTHDLNFAESGQTWSQMLADAPTQIDASINPSRHNIIIAYEDVNAILAYKQSAVDTLAIAKQYMQGRMNAGYDRSIIVNSYNSRVPFPLGVNPEDMEQLYEYFELIKTDYSPANALVDLRLSPNMGGPKDQPINFDYFHDSIHPTNNTPVGSTISLGCQEIADQIITQGIAKLYNY